jgi:hypothetical protein
VTLNGSSSKPKYLPYMPREKPISPSGELQEEVTVSCEPDFITWRQRAADRLANRFQALCRPCSLRNNRLNKPLDCSSPSLVNSQ